LQVAKGQQYAAKRVPDDEVLFIPNWYTIHGIDFSDAAHENCYFSDDLVGYALRRGWYRPVNAGDYSDFDFAKAYQAGAENRFNIPRARNAWRILLGEEPADIRQFSAKLGRKIGLEEAKRVMRSHFEGTSDDITDDYALNPHMDPMRHFTICNAWTTESSVIEFNEDPALTCIWRAVLTPCISPYVPWYLGITKIPDGYNWSDPLEAQKTHFCPPAADDAYNSTRAFWAFMTVKYLTDFDYKGTHGAIQASIREMEATWNGEQQNTQQAYKALRMKDSALAAAYLTDYTAVQAKKAWDFAQNMIQRLGEAKILSNEGNSVE
jgi:dipeptidase